MADIEIIFHTSSAPKRCSNVDAVYTKDALLCVQYSDGMIVKYPLSNVFSVAGPHGSHWGSSRERNLASAADSTAAQERGNL